MLKNLRKSWITFAWTVLASAATNAASATNEPVPDFGELRTPPPLVPPRTATYFGISTVVSRGTTLILLANETQCQTFLTMSGRRLYLLNGRLHSKHCEESNVIGIPNFFVRMPVIPPKA
jgi:hypothetical protein